MEGLGHLAARDERRSKREASTAAKKEHKLKTIDVEGELRGVVEVVFKTGSAVQYQDPGLLAPKVMFKGWKDLGYSENVRLAIVQIMEKISAGPSSTSKCKVRVVQGPPTASSSFSEIRMPLGGRRASSATSLP
jgi:hypothetical protein